MVTSCLCEPGEYLSELYRTDGIVQESAIEQLFANFYRLEPYEFTTSSAHHNELRTANTFFTTHYAQFENHIRQYHDQKVEEPEVIERCGDCCVCEFLCVVSDCVEEFANTVRLNMIVNEDLEILEKLISTYSDYTKFVVLLENQLPALSQLIGKMPAVNYPFSLWKFLHRQFVEHVLAPLEEQLLGAFVRTIGKIRWEVIKTGNERGKELSMECQDQIFQLREVASIVASKSIDERSVHFLESTQSKYNTVSCKMLEELVKAQTREIYTECAGTLANKARWSTLVAGDTKVLGRVLLAGELKRVAEDCVATAKDVWHSCAEQVECKWSFHMRDKEVETYAKRLGILASA